MRIKSAPVPIRVVSHNIRYATTKPSTGEEPWPVRLPLILEQLQFSTLHIPETFICLQEALHGQLHDILAGLNSKSLSAFEASGSEESETGLSTELEVKIANSKAGHSPEWAFLGVGRDDGQMAGEYEPIVYRPSVFKLIERIHIWLSETPHIPGSKSWDAASVRMATLGVFTHRATGKEVTICNTHLDDQGAVSRREGAWLLCELLQEYSHAGNTDDPHKVTMLPDRTADPVVVLAGDLNSTPQGEAYAILSGGLNSHSQLKVHFQPLALEPDISSPVSNRPIFAAPNWQPPSRDDTPSPRSILHHSFSPRRVHDSHPQAHDGYFRRNPRTNRSSEASSSNHYSPLQTQSRNNSPRNCPQRSSPGTETPQAAHTNSPVVDARHHAQHQYGDTMTFTGFRGKKHDEQHLDFVFVGPAPSENDDKKPSDRHSSLLSNSVNSDSPSGQLRRLSELVGQGGAQDRTRERGWEVRSFAVLPNRFDDGVWMSDHRACVADLVLL